jgi:hypothetical protein
VGQELTEVADEKPALNDPVVAEEYANAIANAPTEASADRPLRRKKS